MLRDASMLKQRGTDISPLIYDTCLRTGDNTSILPNECMISEHIPFQKNIFQKRASTTVHLLILRFQLSCSGRSGSATNARERSSLYAVRLWHLEMHSESRMLD